MKFIASEWIRSADIDMEAIEELKHKENLTPLVSFHAQQVIEKVFKAILEQNEVHVPRSHKLADLYKIVLKFTSIILEPTENDVMDKLDQLYIETRYPSDLGLMPHGRPSVDDVEQFYILAKRIYTEVVNCLNMGTVSN